MSLKKTFVRSLFGVTVVAGAVGLTAGCASEQSGDDQGDDDAALSAPGGKFGPSLFRNDFYTYLKENGGYTDDEIRELVLMPTQNAITPGAKVDPGNPLKALDESYAKIRPIDFYQQGLITPLSRRIGPTGGLETELERNPVHIVIVPGIFGEFIPVSPFDEVFNHGGAASVDWSRKLAAAKADPAKKDFTHDKQFSNANLADVDRGLEDLVRVGSLDDANGKPLVTITYLKPELGSLETFGSLDENANYYLPRLDKYFKVAGMPEHLYVMGYSRGTATALNLITRAQQEHASWYSHLKGMIGLAGVFYGSQLADAAFDTPGPEKDILGLVEDFVGNKLASCNGATGLNQLELRAKNDLAWLSFAGHAASLVYHNSSIVNPHKGDLQREGVDPANADLGRMDKFLLRVIAGDPQKVFSSEGDTSESLGVLHLGPSAYNAEYCQNIDRAKKLVAEVLTGARTLTTNSRVDWFKTHVLPANIRYYAITGSMGDVTTSSSSLSPLVLNPRAYDTRSLDFQSLRGNYYDLYTASKNELQDSQVAVQRGQIWNDVAKAINPNQPALKTHFMGTVGIHHWGLSFPRAYSTKDGLTANPFPRNILLKTIATFVAQVESRAGVE